MPQKITSRGLEKHLDEPVKVKSNKSLIYGSLTKRDGKYIIDTSIESGNTDYLLKDHDIIYLTVKQEKIGNVAWITTRPYTISI